MTPAAWCRKELGHVALHAPGIRPEQLARPRAEVEAESVAYIVTATHGLDSEDYTVPYVTGWAGGDLTLVRETAERVLGTASRILQHTPPPATVQLPSGHDGQRLARQATGPARSTRRDSALAAVTSVQERASSRELLP